MKKLTIEHLSAYLTYDLKVLSGDSKVIYKLTGINAYKHTYSRLVELSQSDSRFYEQSIDYCKPILRPLSDLTKEIEMNGEKFIIFDKIKHLVEYKCKVSINFDGNLIFDIRDGQYMFYSDFEKIQKLLFKHHFDVSGLIEKGLAIDINTI